MKKLISMGLSLILITSLFAGCGQQETAVSKPAETQASAPAGKPDSFKLPDDFTGDWTGVDGFLHVTADARIETPFGLKIPTAEVKKKQFTQADANMLMNEFIGNAELWHYKPGRKEDRQKNGRITISRTFEQTEQSKYWLYGYSEVNDNIIKVDINNYGKIFASFLNEEYGNAMGPNCVPMKISLNISKDDAIAAADDVLHRLGLNHYVCQNAAGVAYGFENPNHHETGYDLFYVPSVSKIPAAITENAWGTSKPDNEHTEESWGYEWIRICTNEQAEIVYFEWVYPQEIPVITTEAASLLPFDKIAKAFPELIMAANMQLSEINAINGFDIYNEFQVDRVALNFMRIRDKYNTQEGTYVPVWDFWATTSSHTEEEPYQYINEQESRHEIVLTINALDGSVVDRKLGY